MYTQTIKMPVQKDSSVVKIAVESAGQVAQLIEFDQRQPLSVIIQELCSVWDISDPESYSLQFSENNNEKYITEKNRYDVRNGSVLRLEHSPSKTASDILDKINNDIPEESIIEALEKLSRLSRDVTFAVDFINKQGLTTLITRIEAEKYKGTALAYTLKSFVELMEHGILTWDIVETPFINKVASYVNNHATIDSITKFSLSILENIVMNSSAKCGQVEKEVTFPNLVKHLQNMNQQIQQNAMALINALVLKADMPKRRAAAATLQCKQIRHVFLTNVIQATDQVGTEMAHQLYVFQTLMLSLLEQRMMTKMDNMDQDAQSKITELHEIAFESDISPKKQGLLSKDYKKLGFKCDINPTMDFAETPPGMLALDCMVYFARNHSESYTKIVLENSYRTDEHECPFGRTSVELVKTLCEILKIGEVPSEHDQTYHPMFFTHDHPFEEFYCASIILLNKTWKEMRATTEDFVKVFSVVKEQITRALKSKPRGLDQFKNKLQTLTYSDITNLWQQERISREEWESHARPILELRQQITPNIMALIQQQRLRFLVEGTRFTKYSAKGQRIKDKFWYVCLSPNHKVFHYGDCDEKLVPTVDELPNKLAVVEIRSLLTGRDCPHMKDLQRRKTTHQLAFSLVLDSLEVTSLDFVAPDEQVFDYWTDGVNALLGKPMISKETEKDLEILLSMEIKLKLLDSEGIEIPQHPPLIPDLPPNYDFCYDI